MSRPHTEMDWLEVSDLHSIADSKRGHDIRHGPARMERCLPAGLAGHHCVHASRVLVIRQQCKRSLLSGFHGFHASKRQYRTTRLSGTVAKPCCPGFETGVFRAFRVRPEQDDGQAMVKPRALFYADKPAKTCYATAKHRAKERNDHVHQTFALALGGHGPDSGPCFRSGHRDSRSGRADQ